MDSAQLQADIDACRAEMAANEAKKAELQAKVDRLDAAFNKVTEIKAQIETLQRGISDRDNQEDTWQGVEYTWFASFMPDCFDSEYQAYRNNLDEYHDAIMEEKNSLRNQMNELDGLLGWFGSRFNDLGSWWAQLTN